MGFSLFRSGLALALTATLISFPAGPAHAAPACKVSYAKSWDNGSTFGATLTIENLGDPLTSWTLTYTWPGAQRVTNGWSAQWSQTGPEVTARNASWNGNLGPNASTTIGFNGSYTGANTAPTAFAVNGTLCTGQPPVSPQLVVSPTTVSVPEGHTSVYTVRLTARPSAPVTVSSTASPTGDTSISVIAGNLLSFTPTDWETPKPVTVAAAEDTDSTAGVRQIAVSAPEMTPIAVTVTESDNDICICLPVTPTNLNVPEGDSASFTVRLPSPPPGVVTMTFLAGPGDPDLTICSATTIVFTPANWNIPQPVRICAAEDADTVNGTRSFTVAIPGSTTVNVIATEIDNDLPVSKADNPFAGATGYVNPDRVGQLDAEAANHPAELAAAIRSVARQPSALWLDRIAALTAGRGLAGHLTEAAAQDAANGSAAVVLTLVLYNLPNRSCAAPANGELTVTGNGLTRYRTEFIDPLRAILARPEFAGLRVAVVLEPDSLVTSVTHAQTRPNTTVRCIEAQQSAVYREGIRYAVNQLAALQNTYLYVDIATSAWLGWTENFEAAIAVYDSVLATAAGGPGYGKIHGFAVNTGGFTATEEVFLPNPMLTVSGQPIVMARFFDWNPRLDDRDFTTDLLAAFTSRGCTGCGAVIDTSRNGWGGRDRPISVSTSTDLETYVNESRIDRRPARLGLCNQAGAGLGTRPTAATGIAGVDAFAWLKPPGESDGVSRPNIPDEDDPFKTFDPMCDPTAANRYAPGVLTNAMPDAPHRGRLFPQHLVSLIRNAYPPV